MKLDIVRAWKDEAYRESLSEEQLALLPANPAGELEMSDADLAQVVGAGDGCGYDSCYNPCDDPCGYGYGHRSHHRREWFGGCGDHYSRRRRYSGGQGFCFGGSFRFGDCC